MYTREDDEQIELFSTCPSLDKAEGSVYLERIIEVARWSDRAGCRGILIYADNSQVDPWLVSQLIVQHTRALCPLVAVQPVYMHPYSVAKMVASIGHLYGRRMYLNMVAGGFRNDLLAMNDTTPHDERYDRLVEYALIIKRLLAGSGPVSFSGTYYKVDNLTLTPRLPRELFPGIFISGSSEAGMASAETVGATAIKYPKPVQELQKESLSNGTARGVRLGILSRDREQDAWITAHRRFPEDRKGQLTHRLASKVTDSVWYKQLSAQGGSTGKDPYWLTPFKQYHTMCPYLVGDYRRVGRELAEYISLGYRTYILDIPPDGQELDHIRKAFKCALENPTCQTSSMTG